jgi:hypothetical protein
MAPKGRYQVGLMSYKATVIGLDDQIDELVLLDIEGRHLICFAAICPYKIELNRCYEVEFYINIFDTLCFEQVNDNTSESIQNTEGFRYLITGKLHDGAIVSGGVKYKEDSDFSDIKHLEGRALRINVDRLDVNFL